MVIDHKKRTITVRRKDLLNPDGDLDVNNLNYDSDIFYMISEVVDKDCDNTFSFESDFEDDTEYGEMEEINIVIKRIKAIYYLPYFDIHDYKVILENK